MRIRTTAILLGLALGGCAKPILPVDTGFVTMWIASNYGLARAERLNPAVASRMFAYASISLYEGWASLSDSLESLGGQLQRLPPLPRPQKGKRYDAALVGLEAQTTVLKELYKSGFPTTQSAITLLYDSLYAARVAQGVPAARAEASKELGAAIGGAILDWASKDGFAETRGKPFTMPVGPQYWVPTATKAQYRSQSLSAATDYVAFDNPTATSTPEQLSDRTLIVNRPKRLGTAFTPGIDPTKPSEPYWGDLRPYGIPDANVCQAPPPAPFSTQPGSPFYRQARRVYETGKSLTDEQREIAYFWADNPGESGTPAGHWLGIIGRYANRHQLSPERTVEAFALTAIATADAFITCWHLKYQLNLVRPFTYIHRYIDPKWQTTIITPPFPEYASGHAIQSAAAAEVLSSLFGDSTSFDDATHVSLGHPIRTFPNFRAAAAEVAMSRLYGGIHYPMGNENGSAQGACLGKTILRRIHTRKGA